MSEDNQEENIDPLTIGELLPLIEAAQQSGFSRAYLVNIAESGRLAAKKIGSQWVTTMAAIEQYKKSRKYIRKTDS